MQRGRTTLLSGGSSIDLTDLTPPVIINGSDANALAVGPNGTTNPTFNVTTNIASAETGIDIIGRAAGAGVDIAVLSSGTNERMTLSPKGTGYVSLPAGTFADPTLRFGTDTCGWYRSGTNQWTWAFAGNTPMLALIQNIIRVGDATVLGWANGPSTSGADTSLARLSAGLIGCGTGSGGFAGSFKATSLITGGANGQSNNIKTASTTVNAATAATITATNLIPAGSLVIGVSTRVTTTFDNSSGLTTFSIGDGTDADRWGAAIARTSGTTTTLANATITSAPIYAAATSVVMTADAGTFNVAAGVIRVTVHYIDLTAETS